MKKKTKIMIKKYKNLKRRNNKTKNEKTKKKLILVFTYVFLIILTQII